MTDTTPADGASQMSALDQACTERERFQMELTAEQNMYGPALPGSAPRSVHLRQRYALRERLIQHAQRAVGRHEEALDVAQFAAGIKAVKKQAQAAIEAAAAELAACEADVLSAQGVMAEIDARSGALQAQIDQLERDRFTGLHEAQVQLTACSASGDQAGAAAAAEAVARIKAAGNAIVERIYPLRLQLDALAQVQATKAERLEQTRSAQAAASLKLDRARAEALAVARDEAAVAFRNAHVAFLAFDNRPTSEKKTLEIEFSIGASAAARSLLGKIDPRVTRGRAEQIANALRQGDCSVDLSLLEIDPLALDDQATYDAKRRAARSEDSTNVL